MRAGIIGAGGHGLDIAEIMRAAGWEFGGWFDDDPEKGYPAALEVPWGLPVLIGVNSSERRAHIGQKVAAVPYPLIHPTAVVGDCCEIGEGSVLAAHSVLTVAVQLGYCTHINVGASISQSSTLGDFCTVGPGARICGDVTIGHRTFIGAGAVISNLATIGDDVVVGAGAVVLPGADVRDGETVVGVPAKGIGQ